MHADDPHRAFRHRFPIVVQFADLDIRGHVNNVALMRMLETGRVEYLVDAGVGRPEDFPMALVSLHVDFRAPAFYRDELVSGCRVCRVGTTSVTYAQRLWRADDTTPVVDATAVVVATTPDGGKRRVPDAWRERIAAWEVEPVEGLESRLAGADGD